MTPATPPLCRRGGRPSKAERRRRALRALLEQIEDLTPRMLKLAVETAEHRDTSPAVRIQALDLIGRIQARGLPEVEPEEQPVGVGTATAVLLALAKEATLADCTLAEMVEGLSKYSRAIVRALAAGRVLVAPDLEDMAGSAARPLFHEAVATVQRDVPRVRRVALELHVAQRALEHFAGKPLDGLRADPVVQALALDARRQVPALSPGHWAEALAASCALVPEGETPEAKGHLDAPEPPVLTVLHREDDAPGAGSDGEAPAGSEPPMCNDFACTPKDRLAINRLDAGGDSRVAGAREGGAE